jgi:hypothetical protein
MPRLPARERAHPGVPVMHAGAGGFALVGSVGVTLEGAPAWLLMRAGTDVRGETA